MGLDELIKEVEKAAPSDDPLDRLAAAALRHADLAHQADELLDHFVRSAREAGCSWAQIGEQLGVTKQAAQQRHAPEKRGGVLDWLTKKAKPQLFTRFTDRARTAVERSNEAAVDLGHDYIGTEHILLGMLRDPEGLASKVLQRWNLDHDTARADVVAVVGEGSDKVTGHIPFTPKSKKTLDLALREAVSLGHNYIGTEHILLGLMRAEGVGGKVVYERGGRYDDIRNDVIKLLIELQTGEVGGS